MSSEKLIHGLRSKCDVTRTKCLHLSKVMKCQTFLQINGFGVIYCFFFLQKQNLFAVYFNSNSMDSCQKIIIRCRAPNRGPLCRHRDIIIIFLFSPVGQENLSFSFDRSGCSCSEWQLPGLC